MFEAPRSGFEAYARISATELIKKYEGKNL
jgi:hypothetical protein